MNCDTKIVNRGYYAVWRVISRNIWLRSAEAAGQQISRQW